MKRLVHTSKRRLNPGNISYVISLIAPFYKLCDIMQRGNCEKYSTVLCTTARLHGAHPLRFGRILTNAEAGQNSTCDKTMKRISLQQCLFEYMSKHENQVTYFAEAFSSYTGCPKMCQLDKLEISDHSSYSIFLFFAAGS